MLQGRLRAHFLLRCHQPLRGARQAKLNEINGRCHQPRPVSPTSKGVGDTNRLMISMVSPTSPVSPTFSETCTRKEKFQDAVTHFSLRYFLTPVGDTKVGRSEEITLNSSN